MLDKLGVSLEGDVLPPHVRLLLRYIDGVPRRLQLLFAALALSDQPHEFQKSELLCGLNMAMEHPERRAISQYAPSHQVCPGHLPVCS